MAEISINTTTPFKSISLNKGKATLVDSSDYDWLIQWKWHLSYKGYAETTIKGKNVFMHRLINNTPKGMQTDHIDGNRLNNRRANLRTCDHYENGRNRKLSSNCASNFKGVNWHKKSGKWQARIKFENITRHLGLYILEMDAAKAYNDAAIKYFGNYARLNPVPNDWIITSHQPQSLCQIRRGKNNVKCTSRYKGVGRTRKSGKWTARIKVAGKLKYLGDHDIEEAAAVAYNDAAFAAWGKDAYLNDIEDGSQS